MEEFLELYVEDDVMDSENIADIDSCCKDDSENTDSEDDIGCSRAQSLSDCFF